MNEKIKTWPLRFPTKETLIWRRHCSTGQSCCSMTSKRSIGWFLVIGHKVFSPERSPNQPKAKRVCIRSINQSNRSIFVCLLFLFCSGVFISGSYENHSDFGRKSLSNWSYWATMGMSSSYLGCELNFLDVINDIACNPFYSFQTVCNIIGGLCNIIGGLCNIIGGWEGGKLLS